MKRITQLIALLAAVGMLGTACSRGEVLTTLGLGTAAAAGAGAYYYFQGDLETDVDEAFDEVFRASERALVAQGYTITNRDIDADEADIYGEPEYVPVRDDDDLDDDADEKDVKVHLDENEDGTTHISVRVGIFGDEERSREIMDEIIANLD